MVSVDALQLLGHPHTLMRIRGKAAIWGYGHTWASLLLMLKSAARCASPVEVNLAQLAEKSTECGACMQDKTRA
jgi:hypothetical protein